MPGGFGETAFGDPPAGGGRLICAGRRGILGNVVAVERLWESRRRRLWRGVRRWLVVVACLSVGIGMAVSAATGAYAQFSLRDDGVATQGQVVTVEQSGKDLECEVVFDDRRTGQLYEAWLDDQCQGMNPGVGIEVTYLPGDPSTVAATGSLDYIGILVNKSGYRCVGVVMALFGLAGLLFNLWQLQQWVESRREPHDRAPKRATILVHRRWISRPSRGGLDAADSGSRATPDGPLDAG